MSNKDNKKLEYPAGMMILNHDTLMVKSDPRQGKILFEIVG